MPYDPGMAGRLDDILGGRPGFEQKKMFGGVGWLLNGNMCVGVYKDFLIVRVGEDEARSLLDEPHVRPMDITGKPMKGWAMVEAEGIAEDADLLRHAELAIRFAGTLPAK
jgi:TfoX/Sxy family transcriptional regulator of competence genes